MTPPTTGTAVLSPDGLYRYDLTRQWEPEPRLDTPADQATTLTMIMLNPSTADATINDRTIVRCIGYARREGCHRLRVVNAYAYRTPSPAVLAEHRAAGVDVVGPDNDAAIAAALHDAATDSGTVIAAWGAHATADRVGWIRAAAETAGVALQCLGLTKDGLPRHPLYLTLDAPLTPLTT